MINDGLDREQVERNTYKDKRLKDLCKQILSARVSLSANQSRLEISSLPLITVDFLVPYSFLG